MTHLAGEQFMSFFGLLAAGNVQEHAEHDPFDNPGIASPTPRGYPAHVIARHDPEVDFIGAAQDACRHKGGPDAIPVGRVNVRRQILESHDRVVRQVPQVERMTIHGQVIVIHIPGPKADAGGIHGQAQMRLGPDGHARLSRHGAWFPHTGTVHDHFVRRISIGPITAKVRQAHMRSTS